MNFVSLLKGLLSLANMLAKYAHDKQLMDAGAAQAALEGIRQADEAIVRAKAARSNPVAADKDPYNRDNSK